MRRGFASAAGVLGAIGLLGLPGVAPAATIEVTETADDYFSGAGGDCSLREAVQAANIDDDFGGCAREGAGTSDTIVLQGGQTYPRERAGIDDTNENGDLDVASSIKIVVEAPGFGRIDETGLANSNRDRAFEVLPGAKLKASKLVITGGLVPGLGQPGSGGGAIRNLGELVLARSTLFDNVANRAADGCGCGGGIENRGLMKLDRVSVDHNTTTFDGGGIYSRSSDSDLPTSRIQRSSIEGNNSFDGGGIHVSGSSSLRIASSAIVGNDARGGNLDDNGGGVYVALNDGPSLAIVNTTISGNRAEANGGGIYRAFGTTELNAVTITNNTAEFAEPLNPGHGGGIAAGPGGSAGLKLRNSIVAGNVDQSGSDLAPDCFGVTGGFNPHDLVGRDGGCPDARAIVVANPKLGPLADNGGPTATHKLLKGSRGVGKAGKKSAPKRDQRGRKRDKRPDIGAYER